MIAYRENQKKEKEAQVAREVLAEKEKAAAEAEWKSTNSFYNYCRNDVIKALGSPTKTRFVEDEKSAI